MQSYLPPAIYGSAVSVGATDSYNNIAIFSSRGPVTVDGSGRLKPELVAPGYNIRGAIPYTTTSYQYVLVRNVDGGPP
jgi:subtilisin family serine protease